MEVLLLYLDDLEDAIFAVLLVGERIRRILRLFAFLCVMLCIQTLAIFLAMRAPAFGAGVAAILTVAVLYRSATASIPVVSEYA